MDGGKLNEQQSLQRNHLHGADIGFCSLGLFKRSMVGVFSVFGFRC